MHTAIVLFSRSWECKGHACSIIVTVLYKTHNS